MRGLCTLVRQVCVVCALCIVFLGRYLRTALLKFEDIKRNANCCSQWQGSSYVKNVGEASVLSMGGVSAFGGIAATVSIMYLVRRRSIEGWNVRAGCKGEGEAARRPGGRRRSVEMIAVNYQIRMCCGWRPLAVECINRYRACVFIRLSCFWGATHERPF